MWIHHTLFWGTLLRGIPAPAQLTIGAASLVIIAGPRNIFKRFRESWQSSL